MADEATEQKETRRSRLRRRSGEVTRAAAKKFRKALQSVWSFVKVNTIKGAKATGSGAVHATKFAAEVVARGVAWVVTAVFSAVAYLFDGVAALLALVGLGVATILFAVVASALYVLSTATALVADYVVTPAKWVAKGEFKNMTLREYLGAHKKFSDERLGRLKDIITSYFDRSHKEAHEGDIIVPDGFLKDPKTNKPYPYAPEEDGYIVDPKTGEHLNWGQTSEAPVIPDLLYKKVQHIVQQDLTSSGDEFPGLYINLALSHHNDRDLPFEDFEAMYEDRNSKFRPVHEIFDVQYQAKIPSIHMDFSRWVEEKFLAEYFTFRTTDQKRSKQERAYWLGRKECIEIYWSDPEVTGKASHGRVWSRVWSKYRNAQAEVPLAYLRAGVLDMIQEIHASRDRKAMV